MSQHLLSDNIVPFTRRNFLFGSSSCIALLSFTGCTKGNAYTHGSLLFQPEERQFLEIASQLIFPTEDLTHDKKGLHVVDYLERQLAMPYGFGERTYLSGPFVQGDHALGYQLPYPPYDLYKTALSRLFAWIKDNFHEKSFVNLPSETQIQILENLEDDQINLGDIPSSVFFTQLRQNVLEGVFSDPLYGGNTEMKGWEYLGFPGARAEFMKWINQHGAPYPYKPVAIPLSFEKMQRFWQLQEENGTTSL
ncbi:gluconate 2-dehydrogenase subunit 3 family protein [Acetobacteraceae bacterium]|nr:gluconate 2-dehydrogenase subunit 3 family protein [Acetobacteraceae bacterium]